MEGDWEIALGNQVVKVLRLFRGQYNANFVPLRCTNLSIFPDLRELSLRNMNILEIPNDLGYVQALQLLDLRGNDFEILPASIKQLPLLETLYLSRYLKIQSILELPPSLRYLYANYCSSLESITNVYGHLFHELPLASCFKLGLDLQQFIQHMIFSVPIHKGEIKTWACFPASELPDCFSYQSTEKRLNIPCSQIHLGFKPVGFVAGILVAFNGFLKLSDCNFHCWLHGEGYQTRHIRFGLEKFPPLEYTSSGYSDLLIVLSYNFGEEKSCDEISFDFDLENKTFKKFKIKGSGVRLCSTQQAQSVLPLTNGISTQDIGELVEERNFSNLRSADRSEHGKN